MIEAPFVPQASEWFEIRVERLSDNGHYLFLSLTTNDLVVCIPKTITESPANHKLCLKPGHVGAARIELVQNRYRCIEAHFDGALANEEEIGQVIRWDDDRMRGHVERPCKDWLFIAGTNGREGTYGIIRLGDWVRFRIERSKTRSGYVGVSAYKISAPTAQREE
jgi:hypothetical protein